MKNIFVTGTALRSAQKIKVQFKALDEKSVLTNMRSAPALMREGLELGLSLNPGIGLRGIRNIVMSGMGVSGSHMSVISNLTQNPQHGLDIPVYSCQNFNLPSFVNGNSLVLINSYRGGTAEAISCLTEARERNAIIFAFTRGGALEEAACAGNIPVVKLPQGVQTLSSSPLFIGATAGLLANLRLSDFSLVSSIRGSINDISNINDDLASNPWKTNIAKQIARILLGKIPFLISSEGVNDSISSCWTLQLNEMPKIIVKHASLPEFTHTEIHSLGTFGLTKEDLDKFVFIFFRHSSEPEKMSKRIDTVQTLIKQKGASFLDISVDGSNFEQLYLPITLGNYTAYYLANLRGVDPSIHGLEITLR